MKEIEIVLVYQENKYSMKVEDTTKSITEALKDIVEALQLSWQDAGGNPITYHLGRNTEEEEILRPKFQGREQTLFDYKIQQGDELILIKEVIAG
ncbi:MAG TPA: hypothetical protein QF480_05590 [Bacteroidales bacterium]|jgi:hypothetical protein|nr:hypothetical protein [Bacteroidales bacterium]|tara:strand:+ start:2231 stop:2515 length:285 start_codon:yes stop_codon:yes gene_type:complete